MSEANFPSIYREFTPAEIKQQQETATNNAFSHELDQALKDGNFKQAAHVLTDAGACRWDALFPGGEHRVYGEADFYGDRSKSDFVAAYAYDNNSTKITVSETLNAGGGGLFTGSGKAYVPRLTIADHSCDK
jgi:hypothetical protein